MKKSFVKGMKWSDKIEIPKYGIYIFGLSMTLLVLVFKMRPYYVDRPVIKTFIRGKESNQSEAKYRQMESDSLGKVSTGAGGQKSRGGKASEPRDSGSSEKAKNHIVERPLFDGLMVTLKAVLTQSLDSNQSDLAVSARLLDASDLSGAYEASFLQNATLMGTASPNFETKRYNLQFNQLIAEGGKQYAVVAFAFDESSQASGVPANYSSGLTSRIAGAALGRAILLGESLVTVRVLNNPGSGDSVAQQEMNRALIDTSHQATGDIAGEATQGLRSTKPELSVPAGTVFTLKLKALSNGKGGG